MSVINPNYSNLDSRYTKPTDVDTKIATQAITDAGQYAPKSNPTFTGTVAGVTSAMVGLGNVNNTSDINKPVSTAMQAALDTKEPVTVLTGLATGNSAATANQTIIQNAINTASTNGGGRVVIPVGTFYTTPFVMKSYVTIVGRGVGASCLTLANGQNTHMVTLESIQTELTGFVDIRLDGNKANQTAGDVIHYSNNGYSQANPFPSFGDPNHWFHRVGLTNAKGHGLYHYGTLGQCQFVSVLSYLNDGNNFYISGPDSQFIDCVSANSGLEGFYIASNSLRFVNCKAFLAGHIDQTHGNGFHVQYVNRTDLIGCEAQDNRQHGFALNNGTGLNIIGGRADRNGIGAEPFSGGGFGSALWMTGTTRSIIEINTGDRIPGGESGPTTQYAYVCGTGNDANQVRIISQATKSGSAGTGSFGTNSSLSLTYNGVLSQLPVVSGGSSVPSVGISPSIRGYFSETMSAILANSGRVAASASGKTRILAIPVPTTVTISNITIFISANGVTLTAGQNLIGLFDANGTMLGSLSADQSTNWTTTGLKTIPLGSPATVTGGASVYIYVWIWATGTTIPSFFGYSTGQAALINAGMPTNQFVSANGGTISTAPTSLTIAGNFAATTDVIWAAIS